MQGPSGRPPLAEEGSGTGSKPVNEGLEELRRRIVPRIPSGTTGFIFVDDGRPLAADFFGSEDLALKLLPKSLESYARRAMPPRRTRQTTATSRNGREAIEFFERICGTRSEAGSTTGSGVGLQTSERGLLGGGVVLDGLVVHYGVRVEELGTSYRRPRPTIIRPRSEMHGERQ